MATSIDVAKHLLQLARAEALQADEPELITNLRMQKLLYYAQGWCLAFRGQPLFRGPIEAWPHGPVAPEAYHRLQQFGGTPIPHEALDAEPDRLTAGDKSLIESVWEGYKVFSPTKLRQMTHQEAPWRSAWEPASSAAAPRPEISQNVMLDFFREQYNRQALPGLELERLDRSAEDFEQGRVTTLDELEREFALPSC